MKKIFFLHFLCLAITAGFLAAKYNQVKYREKQTEVKPLSQLGDVNQEAIENIKGQWIIEESQFILEFSNQFACRVDGLKYFHYKRLHSNSRDPYIYTIVKSKESGKLYFARGYYKDGRLFGNTSRIEFVKNQLLVYSSKNQKELYFKARRIVKKSE